MPVVEYEPYSGEPKSVAPATAKEWLLLWYEVGEVIEVLHAADEV